MSGAGFSPVSHCQCSVMFMAIVPEQQIIFIPPFFEVHSAPDILLLLPSSSDSCVVDHVSLVAVVFYWTFVLIPMLTVASFVLFICLHVPPGYVVALYFG